MNNLLLNSILAQSEVNWVLSEEVGNFWICVVAGILLALAFQYVLTNLSVAMGISAIGDLTDKESSHSSSNNSDDTPLGVKISTGVGLFLLVTMTISLFFASLIAVKLSFIPNNTIGFTLGLIIWAGYLLIALYMDSKIVSSLMGAVFSTVKGALSTGTSAVGKVLGGGEKGKIKAAAKETVQTIQEEIRKEYDSGDIQSKLDDYISTLAPQKIDLDSIHQHLEELVNDIEVREAYTPDDPEANKRLFLEVAGKQPSISAKDKEKLSDAYSKVRDALKSDGSRMDKAKAVVDKLSPGNEEQAKEYRHKVEKYLKDLNKEELNPEKLEEDLNRILHNPKAAPEVIKSRLSKIDKSTFTAILASNGMSEQKAEKYLNTVGKVIDRIKSSVSGVTQQAKSSADSIREQKPSSSGENGNVKDKNKAKAESAIQSWFNRMNQPQLRYDRLKMDVEGILDDPKAAPKIVKSRLEKLDRDSLLALISNNKAISKDQAEQVVSNIEQARDSVVDKVNEIQQKVEAKLQEAKEMAVQQAEYARETAAAAAWWMFASVVVSGAASAVGGILALTL